MALPRFVFLVPSLALVIGCGSPATQPPGDAGTTDAGSADAGGSTQQSSDAGMANTVDGIIVFRGLGEGIAFKAELYRTPVAAPAPITRGDGHCDLHAVGESDDDFFNAIPPGTLDLGAAVTATSGATTFSAMVEATGGDFQYEFAQAGFDAFGQTWTLANTGSPTGLAASTLATVHVPTQVNPIVPAPMGGSVDTTSGHVTLQWTGGTGAQSFHVFIHSEKGDVDCYPEPTATSFDLPAEIVKMLDPQVVPALWAESVSVVQLGERRVFVRVTSDNLD